MALLRFLIVLQLAAGGVAMAVVEEREATVEQAAASTTIPPPTAPTTTATTRRPAATVTTAPTTTKPAGQPLKPAAAGKYRYRQRLTDPEGTTEWTGGFTLGPARGEGDELRQVHVGIDEDFLTTRIRYVWRRDGLYLDSLGESQAGDGDDEDHYCDFDPDIRLVASPLAVGKSWAFTSECRDADGNINGTQPHTGTARATRTDRVTVAGRQVAVHVIETQGTMVRGRLVVDFRSQQFFSLEHGQTVREETTYRYTVEEQQFEEQESYELLNLDPQ